MSTNKDQIHFSSNFDNFKFHLKRGRGHLASYILNRIKWFLLPKIRYVSKYPEHVDVELSSACNMRCPMCYTITDNFKRNVKRTNMTLERVEKL